MMKRILLLTNKFMDIYLDIIQELQRQNYDVTFWEDFSIDEDPFFIREKKYSKRLYSKREQYLNSRWDKLLNEKNENMHFDFFFVIDGKSVCGSLIQKLYIKNPNIIKILYLYDRTYKNYSFDLNFKYFDKVYTFDSFDSRFYKISHLPIYWVPCAMNTKTKYSIFGYATYQKKRYECFSKLYELFKNNAKPCFIKLYVTPNQDNYLKMIFRKFFKKNVLNNLNPELVSHITLSPQNFRSVISESDIVLDTHNSFQDGLTARFMWALGAGKKIITTNKDAINYSFYSPDEIYIINDSYNISHDFLNKVYIQSDEIRKVVDKYRIDNWIKTMFE